MLVSATAVVYSQKMRKKKKSQDGNVYPVFVQRHLLLCSIADRVGTEVTALRDTVSWRFFLFWGGNVKKKRKKSVSDVRRRADPDFMSLAPKRGIQPHKKLKVHLHGVEKLKIKFKKKNQCSLSLAVLPVFVDPEVWHPGKRASCRNSN